MKLTKITTGILILVLFSSCGKRQNPFGEEAEVRTYSTLVMQKQDAELLSVYPATIRGQEDIEIRPRIDGFIEAIYVDEGSVVRKGQSLFKINSPQSEQALTTAKAQVSSATAQVNTARINVNRVRPLAEKGIVGTVQLETAENSYETALAALEQANAALKNAQATISWTNVTSPVNGIVESIPFRNGSLVNPANVLTTVANTENVYVYFSLNEKALSEFLNTLEGKTQAEKIKNAPKVILTLANGTEYEERGKLETITGIVNITTGSATFRAEFPNKDGVLRSGTSGKIGIPRTLQDVFVISQKCTFTQQDKTLVYKVLGDSVVQTIVSVISTPDGKDYAVTQGLNVNDRIIADGVATLSNKQKIKIQ